MWLLGGKAKSVLRLGAGKCSERAVENGQSALM